jgi:hypothetical protein
VPHIHNFVEISRKTYIDKGKAKIMVYFRCSICSKPKFKSEDA